MADALTLNAPTALPSFVQKWQQLQPYAQTIPQDASNAVFNLDLTRLKAGQTPYSPDETLLGLQSAADLQNHLPTQHRKGLLGMIEGVPSAALHDLSNVLTNVPHLPGQVIHEIGALPQAPAAISQGLAHGSLAEIARAPGVRDIPGAFVAQNLSHPSELLKHPGMTLLDLAPYTSEGIKLLPEAFRDSVKTQLGQTMDKFQVGPVATGTTRMVNVAQRQADLAIHAISSEAAKLVEGLPPEVGAKLQRALVAEPHASPVLDGQMELAGIANNATADFTPSEIEQFSRLKDWQSRIDSIRKGSRQAAAAAIADSYGTPYAELAAKHADLIDQVVRQTGAAPKDVFDAIMKREGMVEYQPGRIVQGVKGLGGEPVYVPKVVNHTLTRMFNENIKTGLGKAYDQAMGVFRTAVLPLSVHWHIVHGTGSLAMLAADTGPSAFANLGKAAEMVREGTLPPEISQITAEGGSRLRELLNPKSPRDIFDLQKGAEIAKMLDSNRFSTYAEKVGKPFNGVLNGSYRVAGMIDQMTGALAYLYGKEKGLKAGVGEEAAHAAGIEQANRVLHDWDGITPVERQIVRSVFPFYAWMKTISKYLVKYPMNHPFRTSIMSNFSNNELADAKSGIPDEYRNYFVWGKPDKMGNSKAAYINRINPFADVTSLFTLGGILGSTNPFIGAVTSALGIQQTGAGQAFPDVVYNPATGKQEAAHKNYFENLAQSFIPQETAISRMLGIENAQQKRLKLTNPESYKNQFWSSLGLPNVRKVNLPAIAANAEINRYQVLGRKVNADIKSGNFEGLRTFQDPRFNALADRLEQLDAAGALAPFQNTKNGVRQLDTQRVLSLLGL